jgi:hypothetical protein
LTKSIAVEPAKMAVLLTYLLTNVKFDNENSWFDCQQITAVVNMIDFYIMIIETILVSIMLKFVNNEWLLVDESADFSPWKSRTGAVEECDGKS